MCSDVSFFIQQATFNNRYLGLYLQSGAVQLLGLFKMGVFFVILFGNRSIDRWLNWKIKSTFE